MLPKKESLTVEFKNDRKKLSEGHMRYTRICFLDPALPWLYI